MSFPYKKVLLVGATSGIGWALGEKFVEHGTFVIAVGRRQDRLDDFVKQHGSSKAEGVAFDITDIGAIRQWVVTMWDRHPDIDCVFLNSGIQRGFDFSRPETVDLQLLETEMTTNYLSYVHLTVAVLPRLQLLSRTSPASLIFTSSGLALVPAIRCANYSASKAALHHWIMVLRQQLKQGPGDVKTIEIIPPAVQTELHHEKNQPDMAGKGPLGMPLNEYTEQTWKGLLAGKEQIPVGNEIWWTNGGFEYERQDAFKQFHGRMGLTVEQPKQ